MYLLYGVSIQKNLILQFAIRWGLPTPGHPWMALWALSRYRGFCDRLVVKHGVLSPHSVASRSNSAFRYGLDRIVSATLSSIGNSGNRGLSPYPNCRCNNFFIPAICDDDMSIRIGKTPGCFTYSDLQCYSVRESNQVLQLSCLFAGPAVLTEIPQFHA